MIESEAEALAQEGNKGRLVMFVGTATSEQAVHSGPPRAP
jgi:hypothetical protein